MSQRLRITGGSARGVPLAVPRGVRPTEGRVREALFSIWTRRLQGARVLDAFTGSGAVGLEALSRGAAAAVLVEGQKRVAAVTQANARLLPLTGWRVVVGKLPAALTGLGGGLGAPGSEAAFDLIYADPPYEFERWPQLLAALRPLLAPAGELAAEHSARVELPDREGSLECRDRRIYGETALSFYRHRAAEAASA